MAKVFDFFKKDAFKKRLENINSGDIQERENLIKEYIPFIIKTISKTTNRYVESENSEEYSIGLEAFNEAIDKYEESKGSFVSFAELVIKSRIYDYLRKVKKYSLTVPISQFEEEEQEKIYNIHKSDDFSESVVLQDEIREFELKLKDFDITFEDLVKDSPKHSDTRKNAISIARYIQENIELKDELMRKKTLPSSKLINNLNTTAKILKGSRKFIIAAVLILDSDLDILKSYIKIN